MAEKNKEVYLKIGIYQSVCLVPVDPHAKECEEDVFFDDDQKITFKFRQSPDKHEGTPIWVAHAVTVSPRTSGLRRTQ